MKILYFLLRLLLFYLLFRFLFKLIFRKEAFINRGHRKSNKKSASDYKDAVDVEFEEIE